jgi:putative endonuclease
MDHNREIGIGGEDLAAKYLLAKGYAILERNWRHGHKEIDIIAKWRDCLVVVEVKTRTGTSFGDPVDSVTLKKQALLIRAAEAYLFEHDLDMDVRFDIIVIEKKKAGSVLEHVPDAFHPVAGN